MVAHIAHIAHIAHTHTRCSLYQSINIFHIRFPLLWIVITGRRETPTTRIRIRAHAHGWPSRASDVDATATDASRCSLEMSFPTERACAVFLVSTEKPNRYRIGVYLRTTMSISQCTMWSMRCYVRPTRTRMLSTSAHNIPI